jgi:hypothetical protein
VLKILYRKHRNSVDHLLMKLRHAVGWRQPVLGDYVNVFEVDRFIESSASRIVIDNLDVLTNRTWA